MGTRAPPIVHVQYVYIDTRMCSRCRRSGAIADGRVFVETRTEINSNNDYKLCVCVIAIVNEEAVELDGRRTHVQAQ